ncbi:MAG: hypothetical protein AB7I29_09160 [Geobacter sp.]
MYKTLSKFISRSKTSAAPFGRTGRTSSTKPVITPCAAAVKQETLIRKPVAVQSAPMPSPIVTGSFEKNRRRAASMIGTEICPFCGASVEKNRMIKHQLSFACRQWFDEVGLLAH